MYANSFIVCSLECTLIIVGIVQSMPEKIVNFPADIYSYLGHSGIVRSYWANSIFISGLFYKHVIDDIHFYR